MEQFIKFSLFLLIVVSLGLTVTLSSAQSVGTPTPQIPFVQQTLTAMPITYSTSTPEPLAPLPNNLAVISSQNIEYVETLRVIDAHVNGTWNVKFSPDGAILATSGRDYAVRLWNVQSGELIREFAEHTTWIIGLAFSPDGKFIATGESGSSADDRHTVEAKLQLWDVETGELIQLFTGHHGGIWSVDFSPDGSQIVTASFDGNVILWDVVSGEIVHTYRGHYSPVLNAKFSPDGSYIVSGGADKNIRVWDVKTGDALGILRGHTGTVGFLAFNSDGSLLTSAADDSTVGIWDMNTQERINSLKHEGWVNSAVFSPAGDIVITGSRDLALKAWDVQSGELIQRLPGHSAWAMRLAFNADGTLLASAAWDNTVRIWGVDEDHDFITSASNQDETDNSTLTLQGVIGTLCCSLPLLFGWQQCVFRHFIT